MDDSLTDTVGLLKKRGFIVIDKEIGSGALEYKTSPHFAGYLRSGNVQFLETMQINDEYEFLNLCSVWFSQTNEEHFYGDNLFNPMKLLLDFRNNEIFERIHFCYEEIESQLACMYLLGGYLNDVHSLPLQRLISVVCESPIERMILLNKWSLGCHELYQGPIVRANKNKEDVVLSVSFDLAFLVDCLPKELQVPRGLAHYNTPFFQVYEPSAILRKDLLYNEPFKSSLNVYSRALMHAAYDEFQKSLSNHGLTQNYSIMLCGLPGTGKTELARQMALESRRTLLVVNLSSLREKFFGESEKNVRRLFDEIELIKSSIEHEPIVLFNEADGFFQQRNSDSSKTGQTETAIITMFLNELERYQGIVIATTNFTHGFDPAFERRWMIKLCVPQPDEELRRELIASKFKNYLKEEQVNFLAEKYVFTPGQLENALKAYLLRKSVGEQSISLEQLLASEIRGWSNRTPEIGFGRFNEDMR